MSELVSVFGRNDLLGMRGAFKRRIHYSARQKYIAWCGSRHIEK